MSRADASALPAKSVALVHVARRRLGLDEATYRALLMRAAGVASSSALTPQGFDRVMKEFRRLGFISDAHARTYGERAGMASPKQLAAIRRLWREFTDGTGDDLSLGKWLKGKWSIEHPRFLPEYEAGRAVAGLHAMVKRKHAKAAKLAEAGGAA